VALGTQIVTLLLSYAFEKLYHVYTRCTEYFSHGTRSLCDWVKDTTPFYTRLVYTIL